MKTSDRHRVVESLKKLFKHGRKPFEAFHIFVSFRIFCVVWKSELFNGLRTEYGEQHCKELFDKLYQTCRKAAVENVIHYICFLSFCLNLIISAVHSFVNTFVQTVIYVTKILRETVNNL